ncbi:MAG: ABC transporter permease [Chloroflexota bacterium]
MQTGLEISTSKPIPRSVWLPDASRRWFNNLWGLAAAPILFFFFIPIAAVFWRLSPADFFRSLVDAAVIQAVRLSLLTSLASLALIILFGTPAAYYLYRRRSRLHWLLDTLVDLPTVLPPAVAGVALLIAFGREGLLGQNLRLIGISLPFTTAAVVLAQMFIAAPFYIRAAALGFAAVDCELKHAAALDGASRWQIFRYIMLPMSAAPILSGCILAWARALGEFGTTIIFAGNLAGRTQTMPLAIYIGFETKLEVALTLSAILILLSSLLLILLKLIVNRRLADG